MAMLQDIIAASFGGDNAKFSALFEEQSDSAIHLKSDGSILWKNAFLQPDGQAIIGQLTKGADITAPAFGLAENRLSAIECAKVEARLVSWLSGQLAPLRAFQTALASETLHGPAKEIALKIREALGFVPRQSVQKLIQALGPDERRALRQVDIYIRANWVYCQMALKPAMVNLKAVLWRIFHEDTTPQQPPEGNVSSLITPGGNPQFYAFIGFPVLGGHRCVRLDIQERIITAMYDKASGGFASLDPHLSSLVGCSVSELCEIANDLGFPLANTPLAEDDLPKNEDGETLLARSFYIFRVRPPQSKAAATRNRKQPAPPHKSKAAHHKNRASSKPSAFAQQKQTTLQSGFRAFADLKDKLKGSG